MKILLTGSSGQLGRAIISSKPKDIELLITDRKKLNLKSPENCHKFILSQRPDWVINCGAYTDVDKAEKENKISNLVNGFAPEALSRAINKINSNLLHISTDFVFDGEQNFPYKTTQKRSPINQYGFSKALGEELIEKNMTASNATILRTSWVISSIGNNFVLTMLRLHKEKDVINVVSDQIGAPTFANDLADTCWEIVKGKKSKKLPLILHWSDAGTASWYDLALAVGEIGVEIGILQKNATVFPIKTNQYPTPAKRPKYSLLDIQTTSDLLGKTPNHWRRNLRKLLNEYKDLKQI